MSDYLLRDWQREPPPWCPPRGRRGGWNWALRGLQATGMTNRAQVSTLCIDWVTRRRDPESLLAQRRDDIVDYCAAAPNRLLAIDRACMSYRPNGKLHNHQSRVPLDVRIGAVRRLAGVTQGVRPESWEYLWALVSWALSGMRGVGPVFLYDIATRYGAWLGLTPDAVYLKAGTLAGTRALDRAVQPLGSEPVVMRTGTWQPLPWYNARGFGPVIAYGGADACEDALCTLRVPLAWLAGERP